MRGISEGGINDIVGSFSGQSMSGEMATTCMSLPNESTNLPGIQVRMEQKDGAPELKDLARQMITALQQNPERNTNVDIGGKDTRPSDLTAEFSPKMDQDLHFDTGDGDDMVMVG